MRWERQNKSVRKNARHRGEEHSGSDDDEESVPNSNGESREQRDRRHSRHQIRVIRQAAKEGDVVRIDEAESKERKDGASGHKEHTTASKG